MWQLRMRDKNKDWTDLGTHQSIGAAARRVLEHERDDSAQPIASLFFRVYADPLMEKSDADILSRFEYQGTKGFYLRTRRMQ